MVPRDCPRCRGKLQAAVTVVLVGMTAHLYLHWEAIPAQGRVKTVGSVILEQPMGWAEQRCSMLYSACSSCALYSWMRSILSYFYLQINSIKWA